ncbi:ArsR/SmtB family transcription factor [Candidatus Galacturonibacter soehngenii]|uniref:Winged helix-turn-helix transcriptional regulator n=1 Tax=Candidatus Galacturonatibacter soehngenii TaxID=2307010 RepID=A0A7V7QMQ1_9FIRM|nr:winged helix-turn-helix domain-containing protein [Candidatus Galacturonibacter soehngenii]KAB1439868.1 winged helix-turn-helix transcriptional regulator [Candidatus Galacturonibacter soehngenii]MBA4685894.1 winged helix-turn-helix transcriptional regulator [Candidatus Galacturonibacter soehngenii]
MEEKVFCELDPVVETMGLLYTSYNFDKLKDEIIKGITDLGFDGEQFYAKNLKIFEKYVNLFKKNIVNNEEDIFFNETDSNFFLILLFLLVENKEWLSRKDSLTDSIINEQIVKISKSGLEDEFVLEPIESLDQIIQFIEKVELEDNAKWKLLQIMQEPKKYIGKLIDKVNTNLEIYESVIKDIDKPLKKLLNQYMLSVKTFYPLKDKLTEASVIYPTLIFPVTQIILEDRCYYGLLSGLLMTYGRNVKHSKEELLMKLKALSDNSKLEIITSLKTSPKYNLEIAQHLGLTPATMSHHMNALLNCGFVDVEKKDGKVYYHLQRENIKEFFKELEQTMI